MGSQSINEGSNPSSDTNLFDKAVSCLPGAAKIEWFFLEYRPWNRKQDRKYRVCYADRGFYNSGSRGKVVEAFGASSDEALRNFIDKFRAV